MLFTVITTLLLNLIAFLFFWGILFSLSFILRIKRTGNIYRVLYMLLITGVLVNISKILIPSQNIPFIFFILLVFFIYLFFIIEKLIKTKIKIWKFNSISLAIIFFILLMFIGKGEFLDTKSENIGEGISIGEHGELLYNQYGGLRNNIGMYDVYGETGYDTIKYDLDIDGFVDIKTVDKNDDGKIDDTIVYTYNIQKILLLMLLLLSIAGVYIFSDKEEKGKNKTRKQDEIENQSGGKQTSKKRDKAKLLASCIMIAGLLFPHFSPAYAVTQEEVDQILIRSGGSITQQEYDFITSMGVKKLAYIKKVKICIETGNCSDVSTEVASYYDNYKGDQWAIDYYSSFLDDAVIYCAEHLNSCGSNNKNIATQVEPTIIKYIVPWVDRNSPNGPGKGVTTVKEEGNTLVVDDISEFGTQANSDVNTSIITDEDDIRRELGEEALPREDDTVGDNSGEGDIQEENLGVGTIKEDDEKSGDIKNIPKEAGFKKNKNVPKDKKPTNSDIKAYSENFFKGVKLINESGEAALGGINKIEKIGKNMDPDTVKTVKKAFTTLIGKEGSNTIDTLFESAKKMKKNALKLGGNAGKILKGVGFIGDIIEGYEDYKEISKKHKGDSNKIFAESTMTITGKTLIGLNPYDVGLSILSGIVHFTGYEAEAEVIDDFKISERYEEVVEFGSDEESVSINQVINDASRDFFKTYNDPNAGVGTKSMEYLKLNSIIAAGAVSAISGEVLSLFTR